MKESVASHAVLEHQGNGTQSLEPRMCLTDLPKRIPLRCYPLCRHPVARVYLSCNAKPAKDCSDAVESLKKKHGEKASSLAAVNSFKELSLIYVYIILYI